jgi:hypothetical protein
MHLLKAMGFGQLCGTGGNKLMTLIRLLRHIVLLVLKRRMPGYMLQRIQEVLEESEKRLLRGIGLKPSLLFGFLEELKEDVPQLYWLLNALIR